jgi:tetratricopeptide (TPR) repeat protein
MSPQKMKGVTYADRAVKLKPSDANINKMLARTYLEVKHYPKAIKLYQEAEKALPKDMDIPFKIATCYAQLTNHGEAMKYYEKAIVLDPENGTKIYEAANSCYDANFYKRANELYQKAEDKGYFKSKTFYDNWALTCTEMKDYDKALFYYAKAREYAPYDKDLILSVAELYMKKGDFNKSREVIDEMLELNPNDAEAMYSKGMTFYKAGNTAKAEQYFNKAFEVDPA